MDAVLQLLEAELDEDAQNATEDPLREMAAYSSQFSYIKRLTELVSQISENAKIYINFLKIQTFAEGIPKSDESFVTVYTAACEALPSVIPQPDFLSYQSLFSIIAQRTGLELALSERDAQLQEFLRVHKAALIESQHQPYLQVYRDNPRKLSLFMDEFARTFGTQMPFVRISHIHCAYQILSGLLQMQGIGDIGADQLVPFAILATVSANPPGLASTADFLATYVEPLSSCGSPVDHQQEYSVIQFMSTCKFLFDKMKEAENGTFPGNEGGGC
jgi:hypothetical protein